MVGAKIVIVDDDQDIRDSLQDILQGRDYTVVTAADKTEGMETIKAEKPDLAILDVMMPAGSEGFELSRDMRKDPDLKDIPILMLTGVRQKTGLDFRADAGDPDWLPVDGFIEKPVNPQILVEEVQKLLTAKA